MNKKVLINMPNFGSDFFENSFTNKSSNQAEWELTKYYYNSDFKGTLSHFYFWKNKITTNEAHSHYLDVSSVLANLENFSYEYIDNPKWKNKDKVNAINLKSALGGFNNDKEIYLKHECLRSSLYYQKNKNYRPWAVSFFSFAQSLSHRFSRAIY